MTHSPRRARALAAALALAAPAAWSATPPDAAASAPAAAAPAAQATPTIQLSTVTVGADAVTGFRAPAAHSSVIDDPDAIAAAPTAADLLANSAPGVSLTHEQGSDLQPTLRFDGFAASPLLGTPQGVSVFVDGVRVNEAFGDVVNWDLIPLRAMQRVELVPIADPVWGLNTLAGTLLLQTTDGAASPGGQAGVEAGSYGRVAEHLRYGARAGSWTGFVAASDTHEQGWAPHTPSRSDNLFAKATRHVQGNDLDVSFTHGRSELSGSQTIPASWMDTPTTFYTAPDWMTNTLDALTVGDVQALSPDLKLSVRAHLRNSDQAGFNSNVNGSYSGGAPSLADPVGFNARNQLQQQDRGLSLALADSAAWRGMPNRLGVGVDLDRQAVEFTQQQQAATFDPSRQAIGVGPFDQSPVALAVRNATTGLYVTDHLDPAHWLGLDAGGRWDAVHVAMDDQLGGALGGAHAWSRFNPSAGVDVHPDPRHSYFLRYAESMRVPMPVELTCASPDAPCTLPNVLVADPDLHPVIAHTTQAGAVWRLAGTRIQLQYTDTRLSDAIQFVSAPSMSQGWFTNVGTELFRTLSLDVDGGRGDWTWGASLSHTLATYGSAFEVSSASNATADASGNIRVSPGDRLPSVPEWSARLQLGWQPVDALELQGTLRAYGRSYAQGNENNADPSGVIGGYTVVDVEGRYRIDRHWSAHLSVSNLFDRRYADFGQLGQNVFTGPGRSYASARADWRDALFVAPGAPRGAWLGVDYAW